MQTRSATANGLSALPWDSPFSSKGSRQGAKNEGSRGGATQKNQRALWSSAPNLDFNLDNMSEGSDEFCKVKEPDFSKSFHNLSFDVNFDDIDDENGTDASKNPFRQEPESPPPTKSRVKVKSVDHEIKDRFSQWKTDQKKPIVENWHSSDLVDKSPSSSSSGSVLKKSRPVQNVCANEQNRSSGGSTEISPVPSKSSSPKRKKKIAVKLKASDLNLSEEQQKVIEEMFRKQAQQNPQGKGGLPSSLIINCDQRWSDQQKQRSVARPKPATRQLSLDKEEIDFERPRFESPEKKKPLLPSRADTVSGSSTKLMERRQSRDRERSLSRNREDRRKSKSRSRSPSSAAERPIFRSPCAVERPKSRSPSAVERRKSRSPSADRSMPVERSASRSHTKSETTERTSRTRSTSRGPSSSSEQAKPTVYRRRDSGDSSTGSKERPSRTRSTSRGPSSSAETKPSVLRRQESIDSTDSTRSQSRLMTSSRIRRNRSSSQDR
jgi:hypothetical protein